jgi:hypothetical protein
MGLTPQVRGHLRQDFDLVIAIKRGALLEELAQARIGVYAVEVGYELRIDRLADG